MISIKKTFLPPQEYKIIDSIVRRLLCLPLYYDLTIEDAVSIKKIIIAYSK